MGIWFSVVHFMNRIPSQGWLFGLQFGIFMSDNLLSSTSIPSCQTAPRLLHGAEAMGGASAHRTHAGHLFGPFLTRSPNPRLLHGPFPVGDMDRPISSWGFGLAPFWFGMWTGPFPMRDMDWPLSGWGHGLAPFWLPYGPWDHVPPIGVWCSWCPSRICIWIGPFPVGDIDQHVRRARLLAYGPCVERNSPTVPSM